MAERQLHQSSSTALGMLSGPAAGVWIVFRELLTVWHSRARQRRGLAELEPRLLRDIGLSRADAILEAAKPFWQP